MNKAVEELAAVENISVHGLGKLGSVVAGTLASRGFNVIGVDVSAISVEKVARREAPVLEPGLQELFDLSEGRIGATLDGREAVLASDASLLVVPTPSDGDGSYSLRFALNACSEIGRALREKDGYHLVVMKSTVLPGACEGELIPRLEQESGKRCGEDFGFVYNPEFIALGNVVRNLLYPDMVLVGASDEVAARLVEGIYERVLETEPPLEHMNIVNAELAKLAVNTYVTMKITYANSLARLCEKLPGGDVDVVTRALGRDTRIGAKYLKGGLGFGGPCFPRDNRALLFQARKLGAPFQLAEATDATNEDPARHVAHMACDAVGEGGRVAVLGLSYKPDTPVVERSQGVFVAKLLKQSGLEVTVYDPMALEGARAELGDGFKYAESSDAAIEGKDAVVLATPWPEFAKLGYQAEQVVFDCWGVLTREQAPGLVRLGVGPGR
ncbi:MAG: nucleotide sugar dehydrogenase [Proteobacteria bacterium]|nr:nucleotide sugar dehydrogenase [Pseudomonadota bacterium]